MRILYCPIHVRATKGQNWGDARAIIANYFTDGGFELTIELSSCSYCTEKWKEEISAAKQRSRNRLLQKAPADLGAKQVG